MGTSLAWRAALAVALMVGFYGLALAVAGGLLWIPYAELRHGRLHIKIGAFCVVGAFIILKSIVPRPDRFRPPGPPLLAADHPRLFAEVRDVAGAANQVAPADVYLVPDVNAWVSQRGGVMGFGGRRVMGLGLPLLQVLAVPELRAVLAHEFGHFHGGDVRIGPWIYKTRAALGRTLEELSQHSGALTKLFEWYAAIFLRVTHAVSRNQELQADALAARIAGAAALASGLQKTHAAGLAFPPYWIHEVQPVLSAGFLPPVAAGFARLLEDPEIAPKLEQAMSEELKSEQRDPYDTHPPLRDRLAALGEPGPPIPVGGHALGLVEGVAKLERDLVVGLADDTPDETGGVLKLRPARELRPISWDEVGVKVHVPAFEAFLKRHGRTLAGITPASLPELDWLGLGRRLLVATGDEANEALPLAEFAVGSALTLTLLRAGFALHSAPGHAPVLLREGERVEPFSLRECLAGARHEAEAWRALCASLGIADADLGGVRPPTDAGH